MDKDFSNEDVRNGIAQVKHPAIDRTLVDLGIVKEILIKDNNVTVIMAFPFSNIPIGDYLMNSVREAIKNMGMKVKIETTVMAKEELNKFLAMEQENWKGSM